MSKTIVRPASALETLDMILMRRSNEQTDDTAIILLADGGSSETHVSYRELDLKARAVAATLVAEGVQPGDRALLLYPSGIDYIAGFFGCLYAGVIAVPLLPVDPARPKGTMARLLSVAKDSRPKLGLTNEAICQASRQLAADRPEMGSLRLVATDDLSAELGSAWEARETDPDSIAFLQYTSGSTASPKGVMVSHGNLLKNGELIARRTGMLPSWTFVSWLPLFHDMGLIGMVLQAVYMGCKLVLMASADFVREPVLWLRAISRFRADYTGGPDFGYALCARKVTDAEIGELDLSSVKLAFLGSEPVRAGTLDSFSNRFAAAGFRREALYPSYGLAEATLFVSGGHADRAPVVRHAVKQALGDGEVRLEETPDEDRVPLVGNGHVVDDLDVRVVDPETQEPVVEGGIGEIWVAGASVAKGYWRNDVATQKAFGARIASTGEGPFLRTGDLGFIHEGEVFIAGRHKDLLIFGGRNHFPQDIELTVERCHPALKPGGCSAFSIDDDGEEKLVIAASVAASYLPLHLKETLGGSGKPRLWVDQDDLVKAIRAAVTREHELRVHDVVLLKSFGLPKTSSGKKQRNASAAAYREGAFELWVDVDHELACAR